MPPAFQLGARLARTSAALTQLCSCCKRRLTVGATDGGNGLASVGLDLSSWSLDAGLSADNGAVFWMDPNAGPSGSDPICVAQLTVPAGTDFCVWSAGVAPPLELLDCSGNVGSGGGGGGGGGGGMSSSASVDIVATSANGDTAQLAFTTSGTQANVYARPAAPRPLSRTLTSVASAWPLPAAAEFDSWLTVGLTDGTAGTAITSIGIDRCVERRHPALHQQWRCVLMDLAAGPNGRVVLAQVTGAGGSASAQLQGKTRAAAPAGRQRGGPGKACASRHRSVGVFEPKPRPPRLVHALFEQLPRLLSPFLRVSFLLLR